jgi:flagellar biosynthesis anti-sigma factor FlgM
MSDIVSIGGLSPAAAGSDLHVDHARTAAPVAADSAHSSGIAGENEDSVALSSAAIQIHQALSAGADARAERVQQLKQQIAAGQYTIDPATIGSAILDAGIARD